MWSRLRLGALAGSAGGLATVLAGLILQPLIGLPTLPDLLQDRLVKLTPGALFGLLIDRLQLAGRPLLYSGLLLLELVVLALAGALATAVAQRRSRTTTPLSRRRLLWHVVTLALLVWLALGLAILPLAGLGPFALGSRFASGVLIWGYLAEALIFSAVTWLVLSGLEPSVERAGRLGPAGADPLRRSVAAGVALAAVATLGGTAFQRYRNEPTGVGVASAAGAGAVSPDPVNETAGAIAVASVASAAQQPLAGAVGTSATTDAVSATAAALTAAGSIAGTPTTAPTPAALSSTPLVTPTSAFYVVSKNLDDPVVKADGWQLSVKGLVKTPFTLTYGALMALPSVEQYRTLACISNDVGGSLMSNARWRGVPLAALLDTAGADPGAGFVLFTSADDYTESMPMALARQATTLVAYQMNGVPLPPAHGFPARIILAGRYGMKNPKWLTAITVARADSPGFWEQQGWDEQAAVSTTSRIDAPADGAVVPAGRLAISGVAYAGDRGIKGVQVQLTAGGSWQDAALQAVTAASTWTAWRYTWAPAAGDYQLSVRATDGTGMPQVAQAQDSYPLGAAGLHTITVHVR
jgi:DMSO/TMAO reductase YedYZ molybdopterin-dependent catalytic subunit